MALVHANDANFVKEVKVNGVVLVDFYAVWCEPCKKLGITIEQFAKEMEGKVKVVKVNIDEGRNVAAAHDVRDIPALFLYKDGKMVSSDTGAYPLPLLKKWVEQVL